MYSVVLMMAMSGGAETTEFGHRRGGCDGACYGCNGCTGGGCTGTCNGGGGCCGGSACNGCNGCNGCEGGRGGFLGLFHRRRDNGCGCCGTPVTCYGGCGGCVGYSPVGGCTGGCGGVIVVPSGTTTEPKVMPKAPAKTKTTSAATIVVTLPADAKLSVDGQATSSTSDRRTFVSPALETGFDYVYTLRAEVVRDGRSVVETQQVTVRSGQTSQVPFNFSSQGVASR